MTTKTKAKAANNQDQAQAARDAFEQVSAAGQAALEQAFKAGTNAAAKGYTKAAALNKEKLATLIEGYDEVARIGEDNVAAAVASSETAIKGVEALSAEIAGLGQASYEDGVIAVKAAAKAKNPNEVVDVQIAFAQASMERYLRANVELTRLWTETASQALAPLSARYAAALEKFAGPISN